MLIRAAFRRDLKDISTCGPVLEAPVAEARAWVGIGPGGLGCAVEDAWPGTGPGGDDGGPRPRTRGRSGEGPSVRWCGRVRDPAFAGLDAGRAGPEWRPIGANLNAGVLTARAPWGTDSDGAILTAGAIGVLTARVGVLTCG